ncbi:hypothetical protein HDU87_003261 [Geranomyces variabilis]|uniref:Uncharacterized protein n=1 Tax=Geranomyces variabilis TaxID=109894 RepID=A0AAD5TQE8_9FUNG|nr:hypothetical protein HDU87_003261 [Geranomyces variabilis]
MTFGKLFRSDPPASLQQQQQQQQQRPSRRRSSASASVSASAASAHQQKLNHQQQQQQKLNQQQQQHSLCSSSSSSSVFSFSSSICSVSTSHRRQDSACSTSSSSSQHSTAESLADLAIYSRSPKQALYVLHRIKELKRDALRLERAKADQEHGTSCSTPRVPAGARVPVAAGAPAGAPRAAAAARWSFDSSLSAGTTPGGGTTLSSAAAASPLSSSSPCRDSPCRDSQPSPLVAAAAAAAADAWFKYAKYILDHAHRLEFDRHDWLQEAIDLIRELSRPQHHHPLAQTLYAELLTNGPPQRSPSSQPPCMTLCDGISDNSEAHSNNNNAAAAAAAAAADARSRPILVQRDNEGAFRLYRSAASAGVAEAAYRAAMMIRDRRVAWGGDTKTESNRLLDAAARQTHPGALHVLAQDLLAVRPGRTAEELKRGLAMLVAAAHAATRRYPHALHDLALVYARGVPELGIKADDTSAMNLLLDAADMNHAPSLHALGKRYAALASSAEKNADNDNDNNDNNQQQLQRTQHTLAMVQHISRAAQLAYPPAQLALSKLHLSGVPCAGLPRDPARAFLLARTAALAGNPAACCVVAIFVRQREVVRCSEPRREARMWLLRAVRAGSETAKRHLDALDREEMQEAA